MNECPEKPRIAVLESHQKEIRDNVKVIREILEGDGKPGLKTQVAIHSKYFKILAAVGTLAITGRIVWGFLIP